MKQVNVEELASRDPTAEELEAMCHELLFLRHCYERMYDALGPANDDVLYYIIEEYDGEVPEEYQQE